MPTNPEKAREYARQYRRDVAAGRRTPAVGISRRQGNDLECAHCKVSFYRSPANRAAAGGRGTSDYCSRACMAAAYVGRPSVRDRRVAVACSQCGAELKRPEWWMAQNSAGLQFCDSGCFGAWKSVNWTAEANPSWAGGSDRYYGSNWHRQSREARKRDGHRCQSCGLSESDHSRALDVHHIRPLRLFDIADYERANKLANLVTLCPACHGRAERFSRDGSVSSWPALLAVMWS